MSSPYNRQNDALKLVRLEDDGDSGWSSLVENYMDLTSHLERLIEQSDKLEMMSLNNGLMCALGITTNQLKI